jgi:ketosteroid isomerase-like protein
MIRAAAVASLALLASACASAPPSPKSLRAQLEKAEIDFAARVNSGGAQAWADTFAEDGIAVDEKAQVTRGRDAIRARMAPVLARMKISWRPTVIYVSPSGEMGFTSGPYEVTEPTADGKARVVGRGSFMTVWKRSADGVWRIVADHGSQDTGP